MINPLPKQIPDREIEVGEVTFRWTFNATFQVDGIWVQDGFDLTPERLQEILTDALEEHMQFAREDEMRVTSKITKAPPRDSIRKTMGYEVAA